MAKYSKQQIAIMARAAGWGARSNDAAEVAMAESGGDASVVNSIGAVGLMQINQPVHKAAHPSWTVSWLKDPINNLKAALVLYNAAGKKFDGPWLDSRDKGGGGGWGGKVSGSSGGTEQIGDDPCAALKKGGTGDGPGSAYQMCRDAQNGDGGLGGLGGDPFGLGGLGEVATQLGRLAQMGAKAGNWLAQPGNWVRVAYVGGGILLGLTAVNVIIRPYTNTAYRQLAATLPGQAVKRVSRTVRERRTSSPSTSKPKPKKESPSGGTTA